jgi:hypothetical protein
MRASGFTVLGLADIFMEPCTSAEDQLIPKAVLLGLSSVRLNEALRSRVEYEPGPRFSPPGPAGKVTKFFPLPKISLARPEFRNA